MKGFWLSWTPLCLCLWQQHQTVESKQNICAQILFCSWNKIEANSEKVCSYSKYSNFRMTFLCNFFINLYVIIKLQENLKLFINVISIVVVNWVLYILFCRHNIFYIAYSVQKYNVYFCQLLLNTTWGWYLI